MLEPTKKTKKKKRKNKKRKVFELINKLMSYTNQELIEAQIQRCLSANEITTLSMIQTVIDGYINDQLVIGFGTVSETTRYYDGGSKIIDIDPCIVISKVATVDSLEADVTIYVLDQDFEQRPRNKTVKTYIEKRYGAFPSGLTNIAVTAQYTRGTEIPEDIKWLATYLASKMYSEEVKGNLKSESIEGYSRTFRDFFSNFLNDNPTIKVVLDKYIEDEVLI